MKMPYYFFTLKCDLRVKNPEFFPRSLPSLGYYKWTLMFIQGARRLTPQFLIFCLKVSVCLVLLSLVLSCLFQTARYNEFYIWKIPTFLHR